MTWNKKLIVVALILLSLFMISTVSAATDTTEDLIKSDATHEEKISHTTDTSTDTNSNSENVVEKISTDTVSEKKSVSTDKKEENGELSSTPDNDVLKADKKAFSELNKTISDAGDVATEIILDNDYIQDMDSDIEIKNGQKITIQGNDHTLDAQGKSRIFTVNGELILKNLKIINSKIIAEQTYGGAILAINSADLTIINCTFTNNTVIGGKFGQGGAICSKNANIINSTFTDNTATDGGAIHILANSKVTISNSKFIGNNASYRGGSLSTGKSATLIITNSTFIKNRAELGGAIYLESDSNMNLNKCIFTNNNATNGGAIRASSNININNTLFNQNNAKKGSGIYAQSNAYIKNNTFINGSADEGGAIYLDGDLSNIENCTFINNQANIGGAILWSGSENDGYVSDCIFVNNSATRFGAVALPSGKSYVSACIFVNNSDKEDGVVGHAWDTYNYTEINNNIFLNNNATYDICLTGGNANLDYNWFEKNATNYMDNLPIAGTFDCNYWLFLNATPDTFILGETNEIVFKLDLYNKTSQKVVKNYNTNLLKPVKLTITNDNVDKKVALLGEPIKYNTKNTGIDNITASIENVKYTKEVNIISENTFTALYENITKSTEEITTIILKHNYTYDNTTDQDLQTGIPINKTVHIIGNGYTISGNNTARIFNVIKNGNLILENIILTNGNSNGNDGGAINIRNANLTITHCNFTQNNADEGGAIYAYEYANVTVNYCNFTQNKATSGGAIHTIYGSKIDVISSLFMDNTANKDGCAIYGYSFDKLTANHNIFLNNTERSVIYLYNDTWYGSKFVYNIDYNWFGNNATDYKNMPNIKSNIDIEFNWLFLNATADPELISALSSSDVSFELFLYNSSSDNVTIYDNSQLKPVNLTLTSVNGNVTNNTVRLGESTSYTTKVSGIGSVTASIYGVSYTQVIKAIKDTSYTALYNNITQSTDPTTIITLTQDYIYDPNTDTEFQDGIIINKTVIIRGDGHSISGNNTAAIFQVTENGNLTLENITLTNGNGYEGGAISVNNGNLTIINTTLTNNTADEGGAIFAAASNVTIINTTFTNNSATYDGGAIYAGASNLSITNTTMTNNTAGENGGAIATDNAIETNIIDSTFTQNNATQWGGAIYTNSDLTVQNSLFQDNNANRGSGVYIDNALFTSKNNTFINNTVDGENYKIRPIDPQIKIENIDDTVEGNPITITITAYDEFNTDLVLSLNGNNYTVKMINGNGQISISDLKPGTYTATIQFNGNDDYTNTTVTSNTFKVNTKPTPTSSPNTNPTVNPSKKTVYRVKIYLTLKKVKKVSKKTRKLYLKVIVKRNGKKLLTKKITLKVKRNKVKAKKTNKNKAKSKKLSKVQGFKFTVKIKGKTYTKKTNKKGKATYTITNLYKKGTYKAKIRYKSKYYKKNGKTIKFKIKK